MPEGARAPGAAGRGFTLIELLVSVVIVGVGLLGIAQLESLAFSSSATASRRSLAAIEASSLAASMHGDRAYWASGVAAPAPVVITGTDISDASLAAAFPCTTSTAIPADCSPLQVAAWDVQRWAAALKALLPNPVSTITCSDTVATPVSCTIRISWDGERVAPGRPGEEPAGRQGPAYSLAVEP